MGPFRQKVFGLAVALAILEAVAPATPAAEPRTEKVVLPLARAGRQPLRTYSLAELGRMFPAFEHEPFDRAGFNHLALPFHYADRDGGGDANEANALAFLLSQALDWAPGCYCTRHAYFVFKRARKYMRPLAKEYDAGKIRFAIADWRATHAVGGKLIHHTSGYSGMLMIYDRTGHLARTVEYGKPRAFFELLGDMSVDALTFLGHVPSPALARHLHVRQCRHRESLADLGRAAWAEERSDEEFGLYERILWRDPGFAGVRYWRANQKWWVNRDSRARALAKGKALDSYLVQGALEGFSPTDCPDVAMTVQYALWLKQAEQMIGEPLPFLIHKELARAVREKKISPEFLDQATRVARRHPNEYWLLRELSRTYDEGASLRADCDMGASVNVAAITNRYMTGTGHKGGAVEHLAGQMVSLGHNDVCVQLLKPLATRTWKAKDKDSTRWPATLLGKALFHAGWFDESLSWYRIAFQCCPGSSSRARRPLVGAVVSAAHAGHIDVVRQILRDERDILQGAGAEGLAQGYLDLLAGQRIDHQAVWRAKPPRPYWLSRHLTILTVQSDLLHRKDPHWQWPEEWLQNETYTRPFRILTHEMFRQWPDKSTDCFYEALEWFAEDDPWAKRVVEEWRRAGKRRGDLPSPEDLLRQLKDYEPVRRPVPDPARRSAAKATYKKLRVGTFVCALRKLLAAGEFDKADELALRHLHVATDTNSYYRRVHANRLIYRLAAERKAAKDTVSPDDL